MTPDISIGGLVFAEFPQQREVNGDSVSIFNSTLIATAGRFIANNPGVTMALIVDMGTPKVHARDILNVVPGEAIQVVTTFQKSGVIVPEKTMLSFATAVAERLLNAQDTGRFFRSKNLPDALAVMERHGLIETSNVILPQPDGSAREMTYEEFRQQVNASR